MKRLVLALMVIGTMAFIGCSKDDDSNDIIGDVIGKWEPVEYTVNSIQQNLYGGEFLELKADNTFLERIYYEGNKYFYAVGKWIQTNGKLDIVYDDERTYELYPNQGYINFVSFSYTISSLSNTKMVLKGEMLGFDGIMTYEKM